MGAGTASDWPAGCWGPQPGPERRCEADLRRYTGRRGEGTRQWVGAGKASKRVLRSAGRRLAWDTGAAAAATAAAATAAAASQQQWVTHLEHR